MAQGTFRASVELHLTMNTVYSWPTQSNSPRIEGECSGGIPKPQESR